MYRTLLSTLAIGKIGLGAGGILSPSLTTSAFLLSVPSTSSIVTRMFGGRELALGALLWMNRNNNSTSSGSSILRQALLLNIAVDSLDVVSAAICYAQGSLDWKQALMVGGGGMVVAGWGALCLRGVNGTARAGLKEMAGVKSTVTTAR